MTDPKLAALDPRLRVPLRAFLDATPFPITIFSGRRTHERQAELYAEAVQKYGEARAHHFVARPGTGMHELGLAADLAYSDQRAKDWAHANASKFGLYFPMDWEDWHIQPLNTSSPLPTDVPRESDDDMTPEQDTRLKNIEKMLSDLVAPRRPDHVDTDPKHTSLGDVLTAEESQK